MSDDRFERDLREVLHQAAPADAPQSLYARVTSVSATHALQPSRWRTRRGIVAVAVAASIVIALGSVLSGAVRIGPIVGPGASASVAPLGGSPSPTSTAPAEPGGSPAPVFDGPLVSDAGPGHSHGLGLDAILPGVPFTWGSTRLYDPGPEPVVIDAVELVGASPGLRSIAMGGLPMTLGGQVLMSEQPVPDSLIADIRRFPLVGGTVEAYTSYGGPRWTLAVFVLSVPANGRYLVDELRFTYHIGTKRYQTTIRSSLDVCAGASLVGLPGPDATAGVPEPTSAPYCPFPAPSPSPSPAAGR